MYDTGCAQPGRPGVYASVASQWGWIRTTVCSDHSRPKPNFCPSYAELIGNATRKLLGWVN